MNKMGLLAFLVCAAVAASQENYAQWGYAKTITVNTTGSGANIGVTQVKFPILIRLNSGNFDFTKAASNGSDIRFTKANGVTRLRHQIERWDTTGQAAEIWVLMDTVAGNGSTTLKMFFGRSGVADSSNSRAVFDTANKFQAVFHLGEVANDTIRDATANGFKGIPTNVGGTNPTDYAGAIGKAKNFMGSNADANGGSYRIATSTGGNTFTSNALNFQNDSSTYLGIPQYTISAWIYADAFPDSAIQDKGIVAKSNGITKGAGKGHQYFLRQNPGSTNQINPALMNNVVEFSDGVSSIYNNDTANLPTGAWTQVVAVRSGGIGVVNNLKIFVNGIFAGSSSNLGLTAQQNYDVFIGSFSNDSGFFNGKIDEVTFSNISRDSNWVRLGYQTQKPNQSCVTASALQQQFPSNLTYSANPAIYAMGIAIPSNIPAYVGIATRFSVSPALPAGLSLDTNTGIITGNPTVISPASNYTVTATSPAGTTATTLNILILTPPSNLSYTVNPAIYRVNVAITNNIPSVNGDVTRYSVSPALPTGLALDTTTGVISGTPTMVTAAAEYTVTASNPASSTTRILNITVMAPPSGLSYAVNPAIYGVGVAIANDSPSVTGTATHYSVSPALPAGLRLDSVTGVVSGTPTVASAAADYIVTASNAVGFTTVALNIRVLTPPSGLAYSVNSVIYRVNAAITNNVPSVSGDVTRYSVSPALPTGLTLDTTTGIISGTPTVVMVAANYTVTASNPVSSTTRVVNITVLAPPTALSYAVNPAIFGIGVSIANDSPSVTGTVSNYSIVPPPYPTFPLPAGLRLDSITGVLSGTPTVASPASNYTVMAANDVGFTTVTLNIRVLTPPSGLAYSINSVIYRVNAAITNNVPSVSGDVTRYSVSPALPTGLALDTTTGIISGTPTVVMVAANYTVTASNPVSSTTRAVNITVLAPPTALSYAVNPATYGVGVAITSNSPMVTGTVTHYSVSPALPSGLRLDSITGVISGTPTVASPAVNDTVTASNAVGFTKVVLNIRVLTPPSGLAYPVNPAIYGVNAAITNNVPSVSGDVTRYSVSPALPTGLALDTTTGVISGTPTVVMAAANYTVTASNPVSSTTRAVNITVLAPPMALSYAVNPATYGVGVTIASNSPTVTGTVTHYSVSPALPAGLRLDSVTGIVSGTPTVASAAANYTVTAANVAGFVTTGLNIRTMLVPSGLSYRLNSPEYAASLPIVPDTPTVTGVISRYSVAPSLPTGLAMDTLTGIITGTPSMETPTASCVVTAANAVGSTQVTLRITVTIAPPSNLHYSANTAVYGVNVAIANNIATVTGTATHFAVSPLLPEGLRLDSISGIISGTPSTGSVATNYIVTVSNLAGSARDTLTFTVLNPITNFAYTTRILTLGKSVAMTPDSAVVTGTAPFTPITYSVNPSLPSGLALDSATGVVSGTPANAQTIAAYVITAHSQIAQFNKADTLRITVLNPPTGLSYSANPVTYGVSIPIVNDSPTVIGTGVTYSIIHPLPAGLSLNTSTGVISGTPTAAQTAAGDTVVATNVAGSTTAVLSITVLNSITAFTYPTHALVLGKNVAMTPDTAVVTGVTPFSPITYSASPILPAGLALNSSTGIVSGTPTAAQASANYVITASNGIPQFNRTDTLHISVLNPPTGLSYSANPVTYGVTIPIVNDSPTVTGTNITYSITHPLPAGLSLNTSTGVISGTPTAAQAAFSDTIVATNVAGSTNAVLSITVLNPIATFIYSAHTLVLGKNIAMTPDSAIVSGTSPFSPVTYSASPALPAGLALNSSTGIVSGTPTTAQASATYVITASNGVSQFNMTDALHITVLNPPTNFSYFANPVTYGVNIPIVNNNPTVTGTGITYSVTHPLPEGLSLNASTGVISGIPTAAQTASNDTIVATNVAGSTTAVLSITVLTPPTGLSYSANPVTYGVNVPIVNNNPTVTGTGVTYSVTHPLPEGLSLNTLTGVISGTPTAAQTAANDTVIATNIAGSISTVLNITVLTPPTGLSYSANPVIYGVNVPIVNNNPTVTGTGITYSVTHPLPAGLSLNASTGVISGTPTAAQTAANDTVIATSIAGSTTTVLIITVLNPPTGLSYSANPVIYGVDVPIVNDSPVVTGTGVTYSVTHPLPAGLSLNVSTGVISGTPTAAQAASSDTIVATNIAGYTTTVLSITVLNPIATFTYPAHTLVLGKNISMTPDTALVAGDVPFTPITYSVVPTLPAGLSLNTSSGIISGAPTTAQTMAGYVITAHSRIEQFNKADTLRITVLDTPANLSYATNPALYGVNIAILNNVPAVTGNVALYSISPALPSGLAFDTVTGVISGTPTVVRAAANYTVTAYNIAGSTSAILSIRVLGAPANLSYNDDPTTYVLGVPASPNVPTVTGLISRYSANPALPPGLVLDSISGLISGTPTTRQSFATDYVITAANIAGSTQTTLNITIVGAPINLSYADDVPTYSMGAAIAPPDIPTVRGIVTQYSIDPALPAGIFFDGTTGYILGTPTALSPSTLYTITGLNPGGSTQATITLGVVLPP